MKYTTEIIIDKPVDEVVRLFDNPDNLYAWMEGLEKFEHLSGEPGQPGAKSKLTFQMGKRKVEMIETVTVRDLPEEFSGTYDADKVFNRITNRFYPVGEGKTRYVSENEFEFNGFFMKAMAFIMPGAFKKQTNKHMEGFKRFAEGEF